MSDPDVLSKARRAAGLAASKAADLRSTMASAAQDARDTVSSSVSDLRGAGAARITEIIDDLNSALPTLRQAGYTLVDLAVTLGVPPKVTALFQASDDATEDAVNRAIADNPDRKLLVFLLRSLFEAWKLQTKIGVAGMKPRGIQISLGLSPSVTIKFG